MLSGDELFRVVARAGGLWTVGQLAEVCGERIRYYHREDPDFPRAVWRAGRARLYSGRDMLDYLEHKRHHDAAYKLRRELGSLMKIKREVVL